MPTTIPERSRPPSTISRLVRALATNIWLRAIKHLAAAAAAVDQMDVGPLAISKQWTKRK
jgi:hypothetical protein